MSVWAIKSDKSDKSNTYARQKCDQGCDQSQAPQNGNDLSSPYVATSVAANPLNYNLCRFGRFGRTLSELERHCPDLVELSRWQQAVEDGQRFLAQWGEQAEALGWTSRDLFGQACGCIRKCQREFRTRPPTETAYRRSASWSARRLWLSAQDGKRDLDHLHPSR